MGPDFATPPSPGLQLDYLAKTSGSVTATMPINQWWTSFGDPTLNSLLQRAEQQNLTLREAYERISEARSNFFLQGGSLRPNGEYVSDYSYSKNSSNARPFVGQNGDPFNLINLGLNVSWEIDLFGKIARQIEAAGAELQFEDAEFQSIRQTLFTDIVVSYLRIRQLQAQKALLEDSLVIQSHTSKLVSERKEAGVSTELDKNQTDSFRYRSESVLASLKQQLGLEFNNLSLLMGQTPDQTLHGFVGEMPLPPMPPVPDAGFPADLLRRRPDVAREEAAVKAASAQIGIAEADLYPQLTLLGNVSLASRNLSGLFETNGLEFSVGPGITWNILHFGRINDNIDVQKARFRQTIARYQQTVLSAVREVEDAMVNHHGFLAQSYAVGQAITADEKAVELSLQRYRAGKANFQRVIDAQQQLLNDRQQKYQLQADAIVQLVRLFRAAGGDWVTGTGAMNGSCGPNQCATGFEPTMIQPTMMQPGMIHAMPEMAQPSVYDSNVLDSTSVPQSGQIIQPLGSQSFANPHANSEELLLLPSTHGNSAMLPPSTLTQTPVRQGYPIDGPVELELQMDSPFNPKGMSDVFTPTF